MIFALFLYNGAAQAREINAYCMVDRHTIYTKEVAWIGAIVSNGLSELGKFDPSSLEKFSGKDSITEEIADTYWPKLNEPSIKIFPGGKNFSAENISKISFGNGEFTFIRKNNDKILKDSMWTITVRTYKKISDYDDNKILSNYPVKCNFYGDEQMEVKGDFHADDELRFYPDNEYLIDREHPKDKKRTTLLVA